MGSHHRPNEGETDVWLTPPWIIERLGPFDLDPCSPIGRPWDTAARHFTHEDDGLSAPWGAEEFVWLNPPYGRATWSWLSRLAAHESGGIALIFARTETAGFFEEVWGKASALLYIEGRLFFHRPDGVRASMNAGAPSVLVAYGAEATLRLANSGIRGAFVPEWASRPPSNSSHQG